jgi:hypothetical protein
MKSSVSGGFILKVLSRVLAPYDDSQRKEQQKQQRDPGTEVQPLRTSK